MKPLEKNIIENYIPGITSFRETAKICGTNHNRVQSVLKKHNVEIVVDGRRRRKFLTITPENQDVFFRNLKEGDHFQSEVADIFHLAAQAGFEIENATPFIFKVIGGNYGL